VGFYTDAVASMCRIHPLPFAGFRHFGREPRRRRPGDWFSHGDILLPFRGIPRSVISGMKNRPGGVSAARVFERIRGGAAVGSSRCLVSHRRRLQDSLAKDSGKAIYHCS
jgi:hypothetical protein